MSRLISSRVLVIWRAVGHHTTVPDNPVAKVMYYLHCVHSVLNLSAVEDIERLQEYKEYYKLSLDEIDKVISLCNAYRPQYMEGRCFFHNEAMCLDSENKFYEVTMEQSRLESLQINREQVPTFVAMAEQTFEITDWMAYTTHWMEKNYYKPMKELQPWLNSIDTHTVRPIRKCRVKFRPTYPFPEKFSDNVGANILISYFFPFWIFGWIFMSIYISSLTENTFEHISNTDGA